MRFKHNEIAITLKGHKFIRIVIEVDNPTQELANLAAHIKRWSDLQLIASQAG
jgi:hypothetical protein